MNAAYGERREKNDVDIGAEQHGCGPNHRGLLALYGRRQAGGWIQARADEYNKAHPNVKVVPQYKGSYNDSLQATILAGRQGKAPALVQIFEVSSQLALDSGMFQPVGGISNVDFGDYIKPVIN